MCCGVRRRCERIHQPTRLRTQDKIGQRPAEIGWPSCWAARGQRPTPPPPTDTGPPGAIIAPPLVPPASSSTSSTSPSAVSSTVPTFAAITSLSCIYAALALARPATEAEVILFLQSLLGAGRERSGPYGGRIDCATTPASTVTVESIVASRTTPGLLLDLKSCFPAAIQALCYSIALQRPPLSSLL